MDTCSEWYEHGAPDVRPAGKKSPVGADDTKLFQNVEDANPVSLCKRTISVPVPNQLLEPWLMATIVISEVCHMMIGVCDLRKIITFSESQ